MRTRGWVWKTTYINVVDPFVNLGDLLLGVGNHVARASGDGDGEFLGADGFLDSLEKKGVVVNLLDLLVVGDLAVVLA